MKSKVHTTRQAAAKIGVSHETLYEWIRRGLIDAPEPIHAGGASVRLWTEAHIKAACRAKGTLKPGPKKGVRHGH